MAIGRFLGGTSGGDRLPAALWLNLLPRARRAVARTRAGPPQQGREPRRNRFRRCELREGFPRRDRDHVSPADRRRAEGVWRGGAEEGEPLTFVAQRQCRGTQTRESGRLQPEETG